MSLIVKLFIAALFSIHQYIPDEETKYNKYFTDVRESNPEDIIPAAHESCRYLVSVFVSAGMDQIGSSNPFLNSALTNIFGGDQALESVLEAITSGSFAEKFKEHNIDTEDLKNNIKNICSEKYSPFSYTPQQRQEIYDFIQTEINILSDIHLNSLGDFNYFGSVNIFDRSGQTIGTLDAVPRVWVPYDKMSPQLTLALLATEDESFFEHKGVDSKAIARMIKEMMSGDDATGGSTVTMQLLKNMYFKDGPKSQYEELNSGSLSTGLRKVREWYWAWPFEKEHTKVLGDLSSKKYILEMYFNLVDFGATAVQGVEQASYVYFSKSADQLNLVESSYITTLLKAPSRYSNPDNYVRWTEPRRNDYILPRAQSICAEAKTSQDKLNVALAETYKKMCTTEDGYIDVSYIKEAQKQSLPFWMRPISAPVSDSMILVRNQVREWVKSNKLDPESRPKEISIQTTINQDLQNIIFDVVRKKIDEFDGMKKVGVGGIQPAKDDTGRKAQFRETDLSSKYNAPINAILSKGINPEVKYFPTIKFRPTEGASSQTLNFQTITSYLSGLKIPSEEVNEILEKVNKDLNQKSTKVGEIFLVEFIGKDFDVFSIETFVNNKLNLTEDDKKSLLAPIERTEIRNQIIKTSLQRLNNVKPRSYMKVGVISENGNLINESLNEIPLADAHKNRARRFRFGDFFWIRPQNLDDEDGVYLLDTPKLQAAVMVMDTNTGEVLANFGGYDPLASSFNRSKDAYRQAGSALKPWIYFYALNKGFKPQDTLNNSYVRFEREGVRCPKNPGGICYYVPKNYSNSLNGNISFTQSLIQSQNIGTYSLIQNPTWGPDWRTNLDELRAFFETIELYKSANREVTIMLGSQEITIEKLVSSFSFFANGSKIVNPQYIKYVTDYKGHKLFELEPTYTDVPIAKPESILQIQTLMAEIANSGTAGRVNGFVKQLAGGKYSQSCYNGALGPSKQTCFGGKTGTSNDAKDVWFIGFSKNFVIGVWVGYDDPQGIGGNATGGGIALPIFQDIVTQAESYLPPIEPFIFNKNASRDMEPQEVSYEHQPVVSGNSCECIGSSNGGAILNIIFDGQYYPNFTSYRTVEECNKRKHEILSRSGAKVCP